MMPVYREREVFLFRLHPLTQLGLSFSLVFAALVADNPLALVVVILSCALLAAAAEVFAEWLSWWKVCAAAGLAALIINPLVSREGSTVLWRGPVLPVVGRLDITLEAVAFGAGMALKLASLVWGFALLSLIVDPDRALGLLRGRGSRSALASALALRMVPSAVRDASDILDAQRSRGLARDAGGRWSILKSRTPMVKRLVSTSLDRSVSLAEAMESRGYGSGPRSRLAEYRFGAGDAGVTAASACVLAAGVVSAATGLTAFAYYPSLAWRSPGGAGLALLFLPMAAAFAVCLLSWSWRRWNWLKSRV